MGCPLCCLCSSTLADVDFKDLPSNPDKLSPGGADYVPKSRKKRRSSSGSASSATASNKKRSKKSKDATGHNNNNNSNDLGGNNDSQLAPTNHERLPAEVVVQKVYVSYFENNSDERDEQDM